MQGKNFLRNKKSLNSLPVRMDGKGVGSYTFVKLRTEARETGARRGGEGQKLVPIGNEIKEK